MTYEALLEEALSLPEEERAELVGKLSVTLDVKMSPDIETAWAEEVSRRVEDLKAGSVETVPADVVFARAREALRKHRG